MLSRQHYDAAVPEAWQSAQLLAGARSAVLVASGGTALWRALRASAARDPTDALERDPVDQHTRRAVGRATALLQAEGQPSRALFAFERVGGVYADFVALGRLAGLGAPSRLGLLLHPEFGPWLSIRALILTRAALAETRPDPAFDPCTGCSAPCQSACPAAAPGPRGFDLAACERGRGAEPDCRERCGARRACPVGAQHAYPREAEAHHMRFR